jgi:hypothetical protein
MLALLTISDDLATGFWMALGAAPVAAILPRLPGFARWLRAYWRERERTTMSIMERRIAKKGCPCLRKQPGSNPGRFRVSDHFPIAA